MSFTIKLYTFSKHENSTKQPTGGTELSCNIKTPSSLISPVAEFSLASNPIAYNYAYISEFNRYYFITDWTFNRGLWIASMVCDVLATYKTQIGSSSLYVLRSASSSDGYIRDTLYPTTAKHTTAETVITETVTGWSDGIYVVNVIGSSGNGLISYGLSISQFPTFYSKVLTIIDGLDWSDVGNSLKNSITDPKDFITSCFWFPKDVFSGTSVTSIPIGSSTITGISAKKIDVALPDTYTLTIPKHPKTNTYGKYVGLEPYSSYVLRFDVITDLSIPAWKLIDETSIKVSVLTDATTGQAYVTIVGSSSNFPPLANLVVGWGVPVALSTNAGDFTGIVTGVGGAIMGLGSMLAGDVVGGAISSAIGVTEAVRGTIGSISNVSSAGSLGGHNNGKELKAFFVDIVDRDPTNDGLPLCKVKTINTLSGFIQVQKGEVEINGTQEEANQIRRWLESGFYYE